MSHEVVEGCMVGVILLLIVLVVRLADYARAMRESRNAWRSHHRKLVANSDDGGGTWDYWREEAKRER